MPAPAPSPVTRDQILPCGFNSIDECLAWCDCRDEAMIHAIGAWILGLTNGGNW